MVFIAYRIEIRVSKSGRRGERREERGERREERGRRYAGKLEDAL